MESVFVFLMTGLHFMVKKGDLRKGVCILWPSTKEYATSIRMGIHSDYH